MKFEPNYHINPQLTEYLLEIEGHKEVINVLPVTPQMVASLRETARLLTTHYSTQIEGNQLSPDEVKQIAEGKKGGFPGRERDEREVRNYFRALEYIESELEKGTPISTHLIQTIHSLVFIGTKKKTPYREDQNVIRNSSGGIVYMPPEAHDVPPLMNGLIEWIDTEIKSKKLPAPVIAGLAHYQFATIHPYYDGNGRTARLLTTYILHQTGYGMKGMYALEEYYAKNLQGYYNALTIGPSHNYYGGRAEADVTAFLNYFLEGMSISFSRVRLQAEQSNTLDLIAEQQSFNLRELKPQQRHALSLFKFSKEITAGQLAIHLGIKSRSATDLLKKWIDDEFIQIENKSKKSRTYCLTDKWEQQINHDVKQRLQALEKIRKDKERGERER